MLVLGGSDGGLGTATRIAGLLSSRGLNALALAYFGLPGLPRDLRAIPVEYVETALRWLAAHPAVDGGVPAVLGVSRGAELALLTASRYPDLVGAVTAIAPSVYLWPAFDTGRPPAAAWTHHGRPLAFLPDQSAAASMGVETMLAGRGTDPGAAYMEAAIATRVRRGTGNAASIPFPSDRGPGPARHWCGRCVVAVGAAMPSGDRPARARPPLGTPQLPGSRAPHQLVPDRPLTTVVPDVGDGTRLEFGGTDQATAAAAADLWVRLPRWLASVGTDPSD